MSDVAIAEQPLTNRQLSRRDASAPGRVTGKLRTACNAIVYEGLQLDQAAAQAGITTYRLRLALRKPHVMQYLRSEREVLRASMSGANILELGRIRSSSRNDNARVNAIKALEQMDSAETARTSGHLRTPGLIVQIIQTSQQTPHYQQLETKPLQTNTFGPTDGVGRND